MWTFREITPTRCLALFPNEIREQGRQPWEAREGETCVSKTEAWPVGVSKAEPEKKC